MKCWSLMILGGYQTGERGRKALICKGLGRGCLRFGKSVAMISQTVPLWGMCLWLLDSSVNLFRQLRSSLRFPPQIPCCL